MRMGVGQTKSEVSDRPHQQFVANLLQFYGNHSDISEWAIGPFVVLLLFVLKTSQTALDACQTLFKRYINCQML